MMHWLKGFMKGAPGTALIMFTLGACGTSSTPQDHDAGADSASVVDGAPAHVELGTGEGTFVEVIDGGTFPVYQGPQGLFHLYASVRCQGLDPGDPNDPGGAENPTLVVRVDAGGTPLNFGGYSVQRGMRASSVPDTYELVGEVVILDVVSGSELDGVDIHVQADVSDVHGRMAHDEYTATGQLIIL